jgi:hypothetical protein
MQSSFVDAQMTSGTKRRWPGKFEAGVVCIKIPSGKKKGEKETKKNITPTRCTSSHKS